MGKRTAAMRRLRVSHSHKSTYFWPGMILSAIAIFFFGWGILLFSENWMGQAIWGALATVIAVFLLAMAVRDSRRALRSTA
jgi:hypothetical protein